MHFVGRLNVADLRAYNGDWSRGVLGVRQRVVCWLSTAAHRHHLWQRKNQHRVCPIQSRLRGKFAVFLLNGVNYTVDEAGNHSVFKHMRVHYLRIVSYRLFAYSYCLITQTERVCTLNNQCCGWFLAERRKYRPGHLAISSFIEIHLHLMLPSYLQDILLNHQPARHAQGHQSTSFKGQQLPLLLHREPFLFLFPLFETHSILAFAP